MTPSCSPEDPIMTRTSRARIRPFTRICGCRLNQAPNRRNGRSEEHTSELQSQSNLVCRLLLEKKKTFRVDQGTRHATAPTPRFITPELSARTHPGAATSLWSQLHVRRRARRLFHVAPSLRDDR